MAQQRSSSLLSSLLICPSDAMRLTVCTNSTSGQWVSNLTEAGGPKNGGTAYDVRWNPDLFPGACYSVSLRKLLVGASPQTLMAVSIEPQ